VGTGTLSQPVKPGIIIGLVAALPAEVACLTQARITPGVPFQINPHLTGIVCGTGASRAAKATETLLARNVQGFISWGTAGALTRELAPGDLLLPGTVLSGDGQQLATDGGWTTGLLQTLQSHPVKIHTGMLAETGGILKSPEEKKAFHARTGAGAVDMETAAILKAALAHNLPGIAIRAVVDGCDDSLPVEILRHTDDYGRPDVLHIVLEIIRRPRLLPPLLKLRNGMQAAGNTLLTVKQHTNDTFMYAH
jgi:adenosylhomocysteine nucleosidase